MLLGLIFLILLYIHETLIIRWLGRFEIFNSKLFGVLVILNRFITGDELTLNLREVNSISFGVNLDLFISIDLIFEGVQVHSILALRIDDLDAFAFADNLGVNF